MPYSFIEIEKEKRRLIAAVFLFLIAFYFLVAEFIWIITKLYFLADSSNIVVLPFFSPAEAVIVVLIALIVAIIHWRFATERMVPKVLGLLNAKELDPKDSYHATLKNIVEEVSVACGGRTIHAVVVPSSGLNAFAISDLKGDTVIGVTEGLLARLTRSQLEAVIGHEAAHVVSGDSLMTTVTCSLFGIYAALIEVTGRALERGSGGRRREEMSGSLYVALIYAALSMTQAVNLLLNMFLSRQKEYRADAVAIRLTRNPLALAEALFLISRGWRGVGEIPDSLAPIFITNPEYSGLEESEGWCADLFSTHPPTKKRLGVLLDMAHAGISTLDEAVRPRQRVGLDEGIVKVEHATGEWLVYEGHEWKGPFALDALPAAGLTPDTWVSRKGEGAVKRASEDDALSAALREGLPGKAFSGAKVCPRCDQPLEEVSYEGAPVARCHFCKGVFADRDVVVRILVREDVAFTPQVEKASELALQTSSKGISAERIKVVFELNCPQCKNKMARGFYSLAYPVEVDRCEKCRAVWFEKDELEILQYLYEKFTSPQQKA